jgi:polar amino acid transport system substrate-binding protein
MKRASVTLYAFLVTVILGGSATLADTIELRADHWCPFNCTPGSDRPGFMVEIATEALALYGHEVNYETLNWARSLEFAENGRIDGVIGTDEDESPDFVFGPAMGTYQESAAFRPNETTDITDIDALSGLRVGGIMDYDYGDVVAQYVEENGDSRAMVQMLSGDNALEQNLQKLLAGRIDLVPEESSVLSYTLANLGITDQVEIVTDPEVYDLYIAFSPALESSEMYASQLTEGVERLRATGRINEILARYGLSE